MMAAIFVDLLMGPILYFYRAEIREWANYLYQRFITWVRRIAGD